MQTWQSVMENGNGEHSLSIINHCKKKKKLSLIPVCIRFFTDSLMFAVCVGLPYKSTIDCSKLLVIKAVARRFFGKVLYTPLWLISRRASELLLVNQLGTADLLHFKFQSNYHQTLPNSPLVCGAMAWDVSRSLLTTFISLRMPYNFKRKSIAVIALFVLESFNYCHLTN